MNDRSLDIICKVKRHFNSSQEAFSYMELRRKKKWKKEDKRLRLKVYKCPVCKGYHLTHG